MCTSRPAAMLRTSRTASRSVRSARPGWVTTCQRETRAGQDRGAATTPPRARSIHCGTPVCSHCRIAPDRGGISKVSGGVLRAFAHTEPATWARLRERPPTSRATGGRGASQTFVTTTTATAQGRKGACIQAQGWRDCGNQPGERRMSLQALTRLAVERDKEAPPTAGRSDVLIASIPTEVLGPYTAIVGVIVSTIDNGDPTHDTVRWGVYIGGLVAVLLSLTAGYLRQK